MDRPNKNGARMRNMRQVETAIDKEKRLKANKERKSLKMSKESDQQRENRLSKILNRNTKDGPSYLVLHTNEWTRLKRQSGPPEISINQQKEYVKSLNEKSRAWTKTWPDNELGLVANYEKKQQKLREAQVSLVETEKQKQKFKNQNKSTEVIKEARQKIFNNSCYGRKLLSAFRESKALEERDMQVKFLKELKKKDAIESKKNTTPIFCSFNLDEYEIEEEKCRKSRTVKISQQNKETYENQKAEAAKAKEARRQEDLDNIQMINELLALERKTEEKMKLLEKEAIQQDIEDDKKSKAERAKSKADYEAKITRCHNEKDKINCKMNRVLQEMYKAKNLPWKNHIYDNLTQLQDEEKNRYERLMGINEKVAMNRSDEQDRQDKEKEIQDHEKRYLIAKDNKLLAKAAKKKYCRDSKLSSDRQSLIVKSDKKKYVEENEEKPPPCFKPCNKLMSALKKRMQQPPPWSGVDASHQEFARNADEMLRDCKYKQSGRKVVDEYMKYNKLKSLDVSNYY